MSTPTEDTKSISPTPQGARDISARINAIDKVLSDPPTRASYVHSLLQQGADSSTRKYTQWDLLCFCVESITLIAVDHEAFKELAKQLNARLYTLHYLHPVELGLLTAEELQKCLPVSMQNPQG